MATVTFTVNNGNGSSLNVSGDIDDAAIAPFTDQLATLLATIANAPVIPPLAPLNPNATVPASSTSSTNTTSSGQTTPTNPSTV